MHYGVQEVSDILSKILCIPHLMCMNWINLVKEYFGLN